MASQSGPSRVTRPSLSLTRRFDAPLEKVYAAWTDARNLTRWFGPASVVPDSVRAEIDARVGGRFHISFDNARGEHHEVGGVYRELAPPRRLVFSWIWHTMPERESQVTVTLTPEGAGTLLTLHQEELFDDAAREAHEHGWIGTLDRLERFLA